jgi:hypothetical protein
MPLDMAVRKAQSIAPSGSVTLPALRREPFLVVGVEAPVALAPQPAEPAGNASGGNFYTMLNNAPRILKTQPTRSSHVGFIRLVADSNERRLVRVVFEPAFVYWQDGLDAAERTPAELSEDLRKRFSADVRLVAAAQPAGRASATRDRPATSAGPGSVAGWELRVAAARKSVVLTDPARLPDDFASRLQLD